MALFGNNKKNNKETKKSEVSNVKSNSDVRAPARQSFSGGGSSAHILRHARITEKATMHAEASVYVFDVATNATKNDIARAVFDIYQVKPRMVRVAKVPSKATRSIRTGITGTRSGGKKAYVYLKQGETIIIS